MAFVFLNALSCELANGDLVLANPIAENIIVRTIRPGQALAGENGADDKGVADLQLRKAAQALETEGLARRDGAGALRVTSLAPGECADVWQCWVSLQAAGLAAAAGTRDRTAGTILGEARESLIAAAARLDAYHAVEVEMRLVAILAGISGNRRLLRLLTRIEWQAWRYRFHLYDTAPDLIAFSCSHLASLCDALAAGDHVAATRALEKSADILLHHGHSLFQAQVLPARAADGEADRRLYQWGTSR